MRKTRGWSRSFSRRFKNTLRYARADHPRCDWGDQSLIMLRITAHAWLLEDPEVRAEHGDVLATLAVPNASKSMDMHVKLHIRATSDMAKDALRKKQRGDWVTVRGAARFSEVAGRTRGFEKFVLNLDVDTLTDTVSAPFVIRTYLRR